MTFSFPHHLIVFRILTDNRYKESVYIQPYIIKMSESDHKITQTTTTTVKATKTTKTMKKQSVYTKTSGASDMSRTKTEFYNTVLGDKANQSANKCLCGVSDVDIYVKTGNTSAHPGVAKCFKTLPGDVLSTFQNHNLLSNNRYDQVIIIGVNIIRTCCNLKYPYTFKTNDEVSAMMR